MYVQGHEFDPKHMNTSDKISVCFSIIIIIILLHFDSSQGGEIDNIFICNLFMEKYVSKVGWESSSISLLG